MTDFNEEEQTIFEIEYIKDSILGDDGKYHFKVHWKGYGSDDDTWEPEDNMIDCQEVIQEYWDKMKVKASSQHTSPKKKKPVKSESDFSDEFIEGLSEDSFSDDIKIEHNKNRPEGNKNVKNEEQKKSENKNTTKKKTRIEISSESSDESSPPQNIENEKKTVDSNEIHSPPRRHSSFEIFRVSIDRAKTYKIPNKQSFVINDNNSRIPFAGESGSTDKVIAVRKDEHGNILVKLQSSDSAMDREIDIGIARHVCTNSLIDFLFEQNC